MAVEYPYTSVTQITSLMGQLAIDLRMDDAADSDEVFEWAIDSATTQMDFYLSRYSQADLAASLWVQDHATWFAVLMICKRRLNDASDSVEKECQRRIKEQLLPVQQRKADAPRLAKSRRPVAVTNYHVDLRRYNGPVRVDQNRSTGVAKDYRRPTDPGSPDAR